MVGYPTARFRNGNSASLAEYEGDHLALPGTSNFITKKGLRLPEKMPFDRWLGVGRHLSDITSSSAWCLGDWLVYGETAFNGRYRGAVELTSLDYQTLRNYAWITRRFPMSRRRETLSFGHHAEVAALPEPERDFWLRKAEEYRWPVKRLRRELKASLRERCGGNGEEPGQDQPSQGQPGRDTGAALLEETEETVMIRVPILAERLESCRAAASRLGLNVETWAGQVLMREAGHRITVVTEIA